MQPHNRVGGQASGSRPSSRPAPAPRATATVQVGQLPQRTVLAGGAGGARLQLDDVNAGLQLAVGLRERACGGTERQGRGR